MLLTREIYWRHGEIVYKLLEFYSSISFFYQIIQTQPLYLETENVNHSIRVDIRYNATAISRSLCMVGLFIFIRQIKDNLIKIIKWKVAI